MTLITDISNTYKTPHSSKAIKVLELLQRCYTIKSVFTQSDNELIVRFDHNADLSPFTSKLLEEYGLYVHCVQSWKDNETKVFFRDVGISY